MSVPGECFYSRPLRRDWLQNKTLRIDGTRVFDEFKVLHDGGFGTELAVTDKPKYAVRFSGVLREKYGNWNINCVRHLYVLAQRAMTGHEKPTRMYARNLK